MTVVPILVINIIGGTILGTVSCSQLSSVGVCKATLPMVAKRPLSAIAPEAQPESLLAQPAQASGDKKHAIETRFGQQLIAVTADVARAAAGELRSFAAVATRLICRQLLCLFRNRSPMTSIFSFVEPPGDRPVDISVTTARTGGDRPSSHQTPSTDSDIEGKVV